MCYMFELLENDSNFQMKQRLTKAKASFGKTSNKRYLSEELKPHRLHEHCEEEADEALQNW